MCRVEVLRLLAAPVAQDDSLRYQLDSTTPLGKSGNQASGYIPSEKSGATP